MRLFIAAEIPPTVREGLASLVGELRRDIPGPRWVRPEGIHLTLRFLGEVAESDLPRLQEEIARHVPGSVSPFPVTVEGLGCFPATGRPRVLWVGLREESGSLARLAAVVKGAVQAARLPGLKEETRPFRPHLTLARFGEGRPAPGLAAALAARDGRRWGGFTVSSVCLFQSVLLPGGAEYRRLGEERL